jgi:hypothetical protein
MTIRLLTRTEIRNLAKDLDICEKANVESVNTDGGVLVPDEFLANVIWLTEQYGVARRLLRREAYAHTLESCELVHQAWARLLASELRARADASPGEVVALAVLHMRRELVDHARRRLCGFDIDALDAGMRVRRAHKNRVGLAGDVDVVGVLAAAGEKAIVFFATNRCADIGQVNEVGCTHVCTPEKNKK